MGDSKSRPEAVRAHAPYVKPEVVEAIERACASAEKVLDTAAGRLERQPDVDAAAVAAVAAGYLALAKFRRETQS